MLPLLILVPELKVPPQEREIEREMAGTNAWGVGQAMSAPQFRPLCCNFSANKSINHRFSFLLGSWGCYLQTKSQSSSLTRNHRSSNSYCRCSNSNSDCTGSSLDWNWNRWSCYFSKIEQAESFASILKFQLEEAIEKEDFEEASKLKMAMIEAMSKDSVAEIMNELQDLRICYAFQHFQKEKIATKANGSLSEPPVTATAYRQQV